MGNFLLIIEYDGTCFSGWQKQPGCRTVQSEIETAAQRTAIGPVKVTAAGRTDRGVHALAQAASITTAKEIPPPKLQSALNCLLPADIAIISVKQVPAQFNARFSAKKKTYQYRIWNQPYRSTWIDKYSWHISNHLNLQAMRCAAGHLIGCHDFSAFDAAGSTQSNKIVHLERILLRPSSGMIILTFQADRFLYKMVRNMVGTLVEVGKGKIKPEAILPILKSGKRTLAGPTAPPRGLFLKEVVF